MFEGFTLEEQRKIETERGWKPAYSALTYCTSEAVVMRNFSAHDILTTEVLVAKRISGAPDCLGKLQSKWGGYTKPSDPSPVHAMQRTVKETFGWDSEQIKLKLAGIIGPWLYKGTMIAKEGQLTLIVSDIQAEKTPFQATLFSAIVPNEFELGQSGYLKSTQDAHWITIRKLIQTEGENPEHLYWEMMFVCLHTFSEPPLHGESFIAHYPPGQYSYNFPKISME